MTRVSEIVAQEPPQDASASEWRADEALYQFCRTYETNPHPLEVDFRKLIPIGSGEDRATHLMHSYPAKLLPNIPAFFVNCSSLARRGGTLYDPFCGTGTVLVEGLLSGHQVVGADANPLARLIASAKTTHIDLDQTADLIAAVTERAKTGKAAEFQPVVDVDKWFEAATKIQLGRLRSALEDLTDDRQKQFAQVAFSQTVRKVSLADPRMSVPVRHKGDYKETPDVLETFKRIASTNAIRVSVLPKHSQPVAIGYDARVPVGETVPGALADLIITSPPYAGAQKYIRASSLSLGWLGIVPEARLRTLETLNIGREHLARAERSDGQFEAGQAAGQTLNQIAAINPLRADILGVYLKEMRVAAAAIAASLALGGHLVLVMGDNQVCGIPVKTSQLIRGFFEAEGLTLLCELIDTIKSRGLMTKRNRTAGMITQEHVFLFRKEK